jgi:hypothetical protein
MSFPCFLCLLLASELFAQTDIRVDATSKTGAVPADLRRSSPAAFQSAPTISS